MEEGGICAVPGVSVLHQGGGICAGSGKMGGPDLSWRGVCAAPGVMEAPISLMGHLCSILCDGDPVSVWVCATIAPSDALGHLLSRRVQDGNSQNLITCLKVRPSKMAEQRGQLL